MFLDYQKSPRLNSRILEPNVDLRIFADSEKQNFEPESPSFQTLYYLHPQILDP